MSKKPLREDFDEAFENQMFTNPKGFPLPIKLADWWLSHFSEMLGSIQGKEHQIKPYKKGTSKYADWLAKEGYNIAIREMNAKLAELKERLK